MLRAMFLIVAPLVGAWIEIERNYEKLAENLSLPLWERGLKSNDSSFSNIDSGSLPLWERGLKCLEMMEY